MNNEYTIEFRQLKIAHTSILGQPTECTFKLLIYNLNYMCCTLSNSIINHILSYQKNLKDLLYYELNLITNRITFINIFYINNYYQSGFFREPLIHYCLENKSK